MRVRTALFTGAATVCALLAPMLAAGPAGASGPPWPDGTVFVANSGSRTGSGTLTVISPGTGQRNIAYGSVEDVAVGADGSVYYVLCSGGLYEYSPANGGTYQISNNVGSCPNAVAIQPNGDLLVSSFSGLYEVTPTGSTVSSDPSAPQDSSLAIDSDGDVYAASGNGQLTVTPAGASPVAVQGLFDGSDINAVRLDGSGNLVASSPAKAFVESPTSTTPAKEYSSGSYLDGVAIDGSGNVFVSDLVHSNATGDQVDKFGPDSTSPTVLAWYFDSPRGLATYPARTTPSRAASSVALTTNAGSTTTTADDVTLTATVDGGASGLSGLVQFASDGRPLGDVVPMTNGVATTTTTLPSGSPDHITATFLGSATERPSQDEQDVTVGEIATTTVLTAPSSAPEDQPLPVSATVTGADGSHPSGADVTFQVLGTNGTLTDQQFGTTDENGTATAQLTLNPGTQTVVATFDDNGSYAQSSDSASVTATAPYRSTTTANEKVGKLSGNPRRAKVTFTVVVTGVGRQYTNKTIVPPTGTVTTDNDAFTCTALTPSTKSATATATCSGIAYLGDYYYVTISYSGDSTYDPSQVQETVGLGG